jgi:deoxyribodipyrimidine photo-lyase
MVSAVPAIRITPCNQAPPNARGEFVLYWMIAFRRLRWNFALDRAIEWASELKKPLVILEALRSDYPWASERFHRFVFDGMAEKAKVRRRDTRSLFYYPFVESSAHPGKGLVDSLSKLACVTVTDDYPCFFLPSMTKRAAKRASCRFEAVDSNGLLPLRAADKSFVTAFSFRAFLQKNLPPFLLQSPKRDPLARLDLPPLKSLPAEILRKWPPASAEDLTGADLLANLPISRKVGAVELRGGEAPGQSCLREFLSERLKGYLELRNHPEAQATSELSPYLHFGHISSHQIFSELMASEKWSQEKLALRSNGSREGWWNASPSAEGFLDQFITWRELGFNFSSHRGDDSRYGSLPDWSQKTLARHARDEREHVYSLEQFAEARTGDALWNAAQRQLVREGRIHNYLRMLWGKKILEWTRTPQEALQVMIELNNRYALDGRDPNSYSGIFWCLGRYDRPWGPERPIFGTVRFMSSGNTARKFRVKGYLEKYGPQQRLHRPIEN